MDARLAKSKQTGSFPSSHEPLPIEKESYQGWHHTLDWEATQCFLIAHYQQLAHLYGSLELLGLVACSLQALEQLLSFGAWARQRAQDVNSRENTTTWVGVTLQCVPAN